MFNERQSCIKLPLSEKVVEEIETKARDWAGVHGAVLRTSEADPIYRLEVIPFTLLPTPFPRKEFLKAKDIQKALNLLFHRVSYDPDFLTSTLKNTIAADDFTARLFKIYETVRQRGVLQKISLGILRCDYILDTSHDGGNENPIIKQVEINSISTSLSTFAIKLSKLHKYVMRELGLPDLCDKVPENHAVDGLAKGLIAAWEAYGSSSAAIAFLVEPFVRMIADQKVLELTIQKLNPNIRILRRTLRDFGENGKMGKDHKIFIEDIECAVFYFRDGYMPHQYPLEIDWDARLMIELSCAIKCPSIQYHLAGTKKVQQELARPEILKKFVDDEVTVSAIQDVFTGLYSLDEIEDTGNGVVALAIQNPDRYVLKPQREGGGNNIYGDDVRDVLKACKNPHELSAYILMDRIVPPVLKNYLVKPGHRAVLADVVSELGIYGVILGSDNKVLMNEEVGHLLRTKAATVDEGGVVAGFSALDGMFLV